MRVDRHVVRALVASSWNYSSRVVGLVWTALIIGHLGVGDYGLYAMGVSAAAMINAGLDNAFYVRSLRIDAELYLRERCARVMFGLAVAALGVVCLTEFYVLGFGIVVAAGELLFNTFKSRFLRESRPDITMRFDAVRQVTSIAFGAAYLLLAPAPTLETASALYLLPYLVVLVACLPYLRGHRPALPGGPRQIALLSAEAFASAVYGQGDVLLIGFVAGDEVAGFYSIALVTAIAISTIGQNYANTYIDALRLADGHRSAAPPMAHVVRVAALTGAAMATVGVGILVWGGADTVGVIALVLSVWVFLRSIDHVFIVVLFLQHRDALRVKATSALAAVKTAVLVPVVFTVGGVGAAVVAVACEALLLTVYARALRVTDGSGIEAGTEDGTDTTGTDGTVRDGQEAPR